MISVAFQAVFVIVGTAGSTYLKNVRTYFMAFNLAISLTGSIMVRELDATDIWPRFIGYCFCIAYSANFPLVLSISSSNVGGFTKKNTANAMVSLEAGSANSRGTSITPMANKLTRYSLRTVWVTLSGHSSSSKTKRQVILLASYP